MRNNETSMSENVKYLGLCRMCENAPGCTFTRDPNRPVLQCEEFNGGKPATREISAKERLRQIDSQTRGEDKKSTNLIGLCSNCDERERCTFPKPEGGVWQCEEYR